MKTLLKIASVLLCLCSVTLVLHAQVPQLINYQGRVLSGSTNFDGSGGFKFALVNTAGTTTYWSNDGTSVNGSEPSNAVTLTVTKALYSVLLGDTSIASMTALPSTVFNNSDVRLRVWFNDGVHGSQRLTPDQRIASVGYAMIAGNVPDGAITSAKIATGAVTNTQLGAGAVQSANIAAGAVANGNLVNSAITINAGSGLGGGGAVSLGGNVTLNNAGVLSLTGGGGISVSAGTGAITLGSNATSANSAGTLVLRDGSGSFSAGNITAAGDLNLSATNAAGTVGVITQNGSSLLHTFGTGNFFAGSSAGNFTMSGMQNTAIGTQALRTNTAGSSNTASGWEALFSNTTASQNVAVGQQRAVHPVLQQWRRGLEQRQRGRGLRGAFIQPADLHNHRV